ncbi:MAG: hypothetical protein H6624_01760 [Bdellovibrionaceae bacterium]|nr:hypothetical protein [Bdellovibrionales bacterium]MCB9083034.1 hypothetical protein [Pseudobdellovibrionaceae bacterium]
MFKRNVSQNFKGLRLWLGLVIMATLFGCTGRGLLNGKLFKERAAETPPPSEQRIEKSFFVDPSGKPKTFLCAWAPEMGRGWIGKYITLMVNEAAHCNIEFEITENYLVGKIIHPSFPEDRNRWKEALKIPISKHYYYEKNKDSYGRETNEWIENTSRSHWSARPMMTINLAGTEILDFLWGGPHRITSAEEIEWDRTNNFLGFSINTVSSNWWGEMQAKIRVNFLKFDHDPSFKRIPYHQENSKYLNILHVMGKRIEGVEPDLYVAHWDVRKTQKLYLNGVPKEHEKTILGVIDEWNETFERVGAVPKGFKVFEGVVANFNHPFDLRYPSLTWISDKAISMYSPLGIGMAHADVRNGKIIWGGVVLYGGMLEKYINAYAPVSSSSSVEAENLTKAFPLALGTPPIPNRLPDMPGVGNVDLSVKGTIVNDLSRSHLDYINDEIVRLARKTPKNPEEQESLKAEIDGLKAHLAKVEGNKSRLGVIANDLISHSQSEVEENQQYFSRQSLLNEFGYTKQNQSQPVDRFFRSADRKEVNAILSENNKARRAELLSHFSPTASAYFVEEGRTVENMMGAWNESEAHSVRTYPEMLDSIVKDLALHEIGHFLGMGHQFKENIVPKEGTVPSRFIGPLRERATKKAGFTNMTSVMGYRNGRTEMVLPAEDLHPMPHDELVLRYLYKGEYPVYDKQKDDFRFVNLPTSGKIKAITEVRNQDGSLIGKFPVSYFPSCNDYEASLGADPYCNRWDRGSSAEDIAASYFEGISDNLVANLYSLVGGGGNEWRAESRLWWVALSSFSRVRLFYDEMRRRLRSTDYLKPLWNQLRMDQDSLFEFSQACQKDDPTDEKQVKSEILRKIFKDKDMIDLCRANNLALNEYKFFVNLPEGDYTKMDHENRYISGGYLMGDASRNWGHIFGSWYQLSNLPLKISSLYTLTTANPYLIFWGGFAWNPFYDYEENKFLYRTLYPREYTKLVADAVKYNLRFASTGRDDITVMGRSVLAAGWMVPWQRYYSNDSAKLPPAYNETLNQQNEFQLSIVAVIISATQPDANSDTEADHYKKFTATIYDFFTGKSATARDVYVLPQGKIFVRANGMFLYPITKMKFWSGTNSYIIAYKVDYDFEVGDRLLEDSVKFSLREVHDSITGACVDGFGGSGLAGFFDNGNPEFKGFYIPPGIAEETSKEKLGLFYDSIDTEFGKFETKVSGKIPENFSARTMKAMCDESIRGTGQILSSAAIVNGYWLRITSEFLVK